MLAGPGCIMMDLRRVLCKVGGIACFLAATWLLTLINPGFQIEGYLMLVPFVIAIYSLGVIGLFGRKFGINLYYLSGVMFLASGAIVFIVFAWSYVTGPRTSAFVLTLPFLFMCVMVVVGVKIYNRGFLLEGVDYLLTKWSIGATMDWTQVMELLVVYNRDIKRSENPQRFPISVSDYLDELETQGYIQEEGRTGWYREQRYKRIR